MTDAMQHGGDAATAATAAGTGGAGALAGLGTLSGLGGLAAKSCCVVPLVMATSGVGGASLAQSLSAWEPYLLGFAWLALALAWATTIRRGRVACASGDGACAVSRARRWSHGWSHGLLALSTVVVLAATLWEYVDPALARLLMAGP